jgi:nitrite reductase (cytochrome c-552)
MKARVEQIQDRFVHARDVALDALIDLINDINEAKAAGASEGQIAEAQKAQRKASFYVDYVNAENSTGFHAPAEALRILNDATDTVRRGQLALHGIRLPQPQRVRRANDSAATRKNGSAGGAPPVRRPPGRS